MRLLVTGATGFVGKALTELACQTGHQVSALVRSHSKILPSSVKQIAVGDFIQIVRGNHESIVTSSAAEKSPDASATVGIISKCSADRLITAMQNVDVVIHTAARAHVMHEIYTDPAVIYQLMNVTLTERLAEVAAKAGVKRFVFLSSIKVNGEQTVSQPFTETDPPNPQDQYAISKWQAEKKLMAIGQRTGMEVVILRPPLIYGPGVKGNFASLIKWINKGIPLPFGAIDNRRSLLALHNLVSAVLLASEHPSAANKTFLLADDEGVSTTQLIKLIAQSKGKKTRLIPVPVLWMQFVAKVLGKQSVADRLIGSLQVDTSKIRRQLGWKPKVTMQKQLEKMFNDLDDEFPLVRE